jgi:hypothetical protein
MPLQDAFLHIYDLLQNDITLTSRIKLTPEDLRDQLQLCLSSSGFVYNDRNHTATGSGPIGLSLMVVIAEIWMCHTLKTAITLAQQRNCAVPRSTTVFMDDCFGQARMGRVRKGRAKMGRLGTGQSQKKLQRTLFLLTGFMTCSMPSSKIFYHFPF